MKHIKRCTYESPCGTLLLGVPDEQICLCDWLYASHRKAVDLRLHKRLDATWYSLSDSPKQHTLLQQVCHQLDEYFSGTRKTFSLPLLMAGTDFQIRVWQGLRDIPFGTTVSYGEYARMLNMPSATRAVSNAVAANALSILLPCYRIVACSSKHGGYAGGIAAKCRLLEWEKRNIFSSIQYRISVPD